MTAAPSFVFSTEWMDLSYEATFASPLFDLPTKNVQVLRSMYDLINPRFRIAMKDMQAVGGSSLADIRVRISMFNGQGMFDLTTDKFTALFTNLKSSNDIAIAKDCVSLAERGVTASFPDAKTAQGFLIVTLYLRIEGGDDAIGSILKNVISVKKHYELANTTMQYGLNSYFGNEEEKWLVAVTAERSHVMPGVLFVNVRARYSDEGPFQGLESQSSHIEQFIDGYLNHLKLSRAV